MSEKIHLAHIAVWDGVAIGFGEYTAETVIDGDCRHWVPGLIDDHIRVESTLLSSSVFVMMPSCVPATHMEALARSLTAVDVSVFLGRYPDHILGLAEMMNYLEGGGATGHRCHRSLPTICCCNRKSSVV